MKSPFRIATAIFLISLLLTVNDTHSLSLTKSLPTRHFGIPRDLVNFKPLSFFKQRSTPAETYPSPFAVQQVLFVVGGPGSGKGTLCSQLSTRLGHTHISAGSLLRAEISRFDEGLARGARNLSEQEQKQEQVQDQNQEGQGLSPSEVEQVRRAVDRGELVRSDLMLRLLRRELARRPATGPGFGAAGGKKGEARHYILLDGFPRNWENLQQWQQEMTAAGAEPSVRVAGCLLLECSVEVMTRRCLARGAGAGAGRTDDRLDVVEQRLRLFRDTMGRVTHHFASALGNQVS